MTIQQQIDCVKREIAAMKAVLVTLESLAPNEPQTRGLFE